MWCFSHLLFVNASISKVLINLLLRFSQLGKATCAIFLSFDDTSINNATLDSGLILCLWYFHHLFRGMPLCMHTNSHLVNKVRKNSRLNFWWLENSQSYYQPLCFDINLRAYKGLLRYLAVSPSFIFLINWTRSSNDPQRASRVVYFSRLDKHILVATGFGGHFLTLGICFGPKIERKSPRVG